MVKFAMQWRFKFRVVEQALFWVINSRSCRVRTTYIDYRYMASATT